MAVPLTSAASLASASTCVCLTSTLRVLHLSLTCTCLLVLASCARACSGDMDKKLEGRRQELRLRQEKARLIAANIDL